MRGWVERGWVMRGCYWRGGVSGSVVGVNREGVFVVVLAVMISLVVDQEGVLEVVCQC